MGSASALFALVYHGSEHISTAIYQKAQRSTPSRDDGIAHLPAGPEL